MTELNKSRNNKAKEKKKIIFAKDKKEIIIMVIVIVALILNTIYLVVNYVKEQNPPAPSSIQQNIDDGTNAPVPTNTKG